MSKHSCQKTLGHFDDILLSHIKTLFKNILFWQKIHRGATSASLVIDLSVANSFGHVHSNCPNNHS